MCGILGFIGSQVSRERFQSCLNKLRHRGPDGEGIWEHKEQDVLLGHRRLAIIDLSPTGNQPMLDETGRFVITFNGEIYNFPELRLELERAGYTFRGHCDTEVLLQAYRHWGEACLERLNGMFAFGIYDSGSPAVSPSLFLARDRSGKKPLYYVRAGRSLRFASELKALDFRGELDLRALNHYLAFGYYPDERCFFEGIKKLPPGHAAVFSPRTGDWRFWPWWQLPAAEASSEDPAHLTQELGALLEDSVRRRLVSDVPVGVFLSGGLDSSLVTAAAAHVSSSPVKTFTIRVPSLGFDESPYARIVARHFGTEHHELTADSASLSVLDEMAPLFDEPLADSSILPTFLISRLTRQHVTVALGGDGGDELFAGYAHVRRALRGQRQFGWMPPRIWRAVAELADSLPVGVKGRNRTQSWREGPLMERAWGTSFFDLSARKQMLGLEVLSELGDDISAPEMGVRRQIAGEADPVRSLCALDFSTTLADDYLVKVDRASMMSALEVRVPFLDCRIVDLAFRRVPSALKCDGSETRLIQRRLAKLWLPPTLDVKRKQGFSIPLGDWFRTAGRAALEARLEGLPDIIDRVFVQEQISGHMRGLENGSRLFALAVLAACCRTAAQ